MTQSKQAFISRVGLLKNLQGHLLRGRWAAMIGGPMIGKTTLASQLANCINAEKDDIPQARAIFLSPVETKSPSKFWSLMAESILNQAFSQDLSQEISSKIKNIQMKPPKSFSSWLSQLQVLFENVPPEQPSRKLILIIDDCDHILNLSPELISEIVDLVLALKKYQSSQLAVCWVGGVAWGDWISKNVDLFKEPLRLYPLSVIPIREARVIIQDQLGPTEVGRAWQKTGGHPFLLERYFEGREKTSDDQALMENLSKRFRQTLKPEEEAILSQLDLEGGWMDLEALKSPAGGRPEKETLDRLCMIGLIVRTLDQGSAVVRRTSSLLFS